MPVLNKRPLQITFLTVMPSPYMRDLFEALNRDDRVSLKVKYLEREAVAAPGVYWRDRPLPSYAKVLPGGWFRFWRARVHVNSEVISSLRADRPDVVVIAGYNAVSSQLAMTWLRAARIPWIFWGELPGLEKRGQMARALRWLAQRPAVCLSSAVAAIGARAARVYRSMVSQDRPVWNIPYCCDLGPFRPGSKTATRQNGPRFLYCGQLVPRKGVDLLVRSFVRIAAKNPEATLTMLGAGPLKEELVRLIPEHVRPRVSFAGFREVEELPRFFAESDVFILPSHHDGWGLVVNQAIGAGLPVIASSAVGAAEDLVRDGENGVIFPAGDEASLTAALASFANEPERICNYGSRSLSSSERISPGRIVDRWYDLCRCVADRGTQRIPDLLTL
jgi:glycosyltransferase involved in cell wall biosynthesis